MLSAWIPVFRTGTWTSGSGDTRIWTEADLDRIVAQYDPTQHEAPAVIGHPEMDSPAYGWVAAVKREGELLLAQFRDFVPEFIEMLKKGLFKKRSIALYDDLTLRHVGFLGAMPPSVKGLPDVTFREGEFTAVSINQEEDPMDDRMKAFWKQFREMLFGDAGSPIVIQQPAPSATPAAAQPDKSAEFAEREQKLTERETALKAKETAAAAKLAETARTARAAEIHTFCEGLKAAGKVLPAWQTMGLEKFLVELPADASHQFAEGATATKQTPLEFMKQFLGELPKVVEFAELAKKEGQKTGEAVEPKVWAATEFAKHKDVYQQLGLTSDKLAAAAPSN